MAPELRKTGISIVGDVPWGTHFCHFYETKEDLLDILLPYFKTGLENNEFCIWVVSDPLSEAEASKALRQVIADADRYLAAGRVEIVPHTQWYLRGGAFVAEQVIDQWYEKLAGALAKGYEGIRSNFNAGDWLTEENRKDFFQYEEKLDERIAGQRMIVLCSYPLSGSSAADIFDLVQTHQLGVVRRRGNWEVVETPQLKQAKAEIKRLNEELEQRVIERTNELAAANEQLKKQIAERWQAEDRIRLIIETIPVMAWSVGPGGVVDFLNQRWMDYAGLSLEQYVTDPMGPIHPEDVPRVIENWRARMALGEGYEDEMRLRRADGEYRWFLVRTAPLRDEAGKVVKWYGVSIDIEDRKRAEEALGASEARLQAAVDAADIGLWDWDLASGQILWLGYHEKLFGFAPGEFDGSYSSFEKHVHPEDLEELNRIVQGVLDERSEYVHEYRVLWRDGSIHWVISRGRFVYNEEGQPIRMYGAVLDITERKRAEETLRKAEERFRALVEYSTDGISLINSEGATVYASPAMERVFGLTMEEAQILRLDLIHPDDRDKVLNTWNELRATPGKLISYQYRFRYIDGTWRWLDVTAHSLFSDPNVQALVVNYRDITESKWAEEELKATSEQLRALSASLQSAREEESTRIAREIHDELGGALTSLRWDLEEVGDVISQTTDSAQLALLRQKIDVMLTLTEATLQTVRRLSSELRPRALDELGLVEAIEWQALQFENRTGIAVQYECSVEKIDLNSEQSTAVFRILQEALTNILRHAQATKVTITVKQEPSEFLLMVKDNGKGVTEQEKSDAHSLGLLGMRERAHLIGAKIDVTGMEGRGTVVALRVPIPESSMVTGDVQ